MKKTYTEIEMLGHFVSKKTICEKFSVVLENCFDVLLKKNNYFCAISARVKDTNSLLEKIRRKSYDSIEDITDYIGIRIVVDSANQVSKICDLIEEGKIYYHKSTEIKYDMDFHNSVNKSAELDIDKMGYRGVHYIIKFSKEELKKFCQGFEILEDFSLEIQIKTRLEDTWANTTHDIFYKSDMYLNNYMKRTYNIMSAMLENVDNQFCELEDKKVNLKRWIDNICKMFKSDSNIVDQDDIFDMPYNNIDGMSLSCFVKSYFCDDNIFTDKDSVSHTLDLMHKMGIYTIQELLRVIKSINDKHLVKVFDIFSLYNLQNRTLSGIINNIMVIYDIDAFTKISESKDRKYTKRGSLYIYQDFGIDETQLKAHYFELE